MVLRLFPVPSCRSVCFCFASAFRFPLCFFSRSDLLSPAVPLDRCFVLPFAFRFPFVSLRFLTSSLRLPSSALPSVLLSLPFRLLSAFPFRFLLPGDFRLFRFFRPVSLSDRCCCLSPRSRAAVSCFRGSGPDLSVTSPPFRLLFPSASFPRLPLSLLPVLFRFRSFPAPFASFSPLSACASFGSFSAPVGFLVSSEHTLTTAHRMIL